MAARILILGCLISFASAAVKLQEMFSWNVLDWNYPDSYSRQNALNSGDLQPENALPVGIEKWENKLFVTVPRWKSGIPATLNYIRLDDRYEPSPKLNPYPSWKGNELGNCDTGLNTVYRIKADECGRLWVLDTGTFGYDTNVTNLCPYALNVYDLKTNQRIRRYVLRPEDIVFTTFIANIAVDIGSSCEDTFAYFSDELGYGLIVYSWEENKSWRFSHSYFMPDPLTGDFNIAGLNFQWGAEGIFGIAPSPIKSDGYRTLYFSPLSSHTEFSVSTRILRNESKVENGSFKDFSVVGVRGPNGHTTAKVIDNLGIQLFNLIDQNAIGCWYSARPYKPQNIAIVDKDDVGLVFPSDIKVDDNRNVWVISDRMPVFLEAELDYSDINFRIYTASLDSLVEGTVCEPPIRFQLNPQTLVQPQSVNYNTNLGSWQTSNLPYKPAILQSQLSLLKKPLTENIIPTAPSYIDVDFPKQIRPAIAYNPRTITDSYKRPWWLKRTYDVYEDS
ncbi:protein yellow [Galleria mellonella]|uniref:Protein yellow n=1 Tax=Galleria mellonella TaxID=7137 RepID=A0A6J1X6H1_GALME|nr:protein yellow [Galleria mellonella]XP_026765185.2 protein yellow [Galleria mellonella]